MGKTIKNAKMRVLNTRNVSLLVILLVTAGGGVLKDTKEAEKVMIWHNTSFTKQRFTKHSIDSPSSYYLRSIHIFEIYENCLDRAPIVTNSVTTAIISFIGDFLAQSHENRKLLRFGFLIDWRRSLGIVSDALFVSGPLMYAAYHELERRWPTAESYWSPFIHVLVDETLIDGVAVLTFFLFSGLFAGKSLSQVINPHTPKLIPDSVSSILLQILGSLKSDFLNTFCYAKISSTMLLPIMLFQFRYVPEKFRCLIVSLGDIAWYGVASFFANRLPSQSPVL